MVYLLYDLLLCLSALFLVPYYLLRGIRYGKTRRGIRERLGYYAPGFLDAVRGRTVIWVHAVSVGETRAAAPLLRALRVRYPEAFLLLSHVTETGREVAKAIPEVDACIFFPFDLSWIVSRVLRLIRPRAIVLVETEIWPNFVRHAARQKIPVLLVNGRISDRSLPRYRAARRLLHPVLDCLVSFCMQSEQDGARIRTLGAPAGRVTVTGNLKFDISPDLQEIITAKDLKGQYGVPADTLIWVAGSTHAGEEEIVATTYLRLIAEGYRLFLILVPRHPERGRVVAELLAAKKFEVLVRSTLNEAPELIMKPGEILLVDTVGEMLKFYAMADLIFVGGSLVPTGGHNVLEASLLRKPVLFGPYMHNFREITRLLLDAGGGRQVLGPEDLRQQVQALLDDAVTREAMGGCGLALLERHRGATSRSVDAIAAFVDRPLT